MQNFRPEKAHLPYEGEHMHQRQERYGGLEGSIHPDPQSRAGASSDAGQHACGIRDAHVPRIRTEGPTNWGDQQKPIKTRNTKSMTQVVSAAASYVCAHTHNHETAPQPGMAHGQSQYHTWQGNHGSQGWFHVHSGVKAVCLVAPHV